MLIPDEIAVLQKAQARQPRNWMMVLTLTLVFMSVPFVVYLPGKGHLDHILDRNESVIATVDAVEKAGSCGRFSISTLYRVTVTWKTASQRNTGGFTRCGRPPETGTFVEVWITADGVYPTSPRYTRITLIVISLGIAVVIAGIGVPLVRAVHRRRQRFLNVGAQGLSTAAVPVKVTKTHEGILKMHNVPKQVNPDGGSVLISPMLYTRCGSSPTTKVRRKNLMGTWLLHYAPPTNGSRIALLSRENERCWGEF